MPHAAPVIAHCSFRSLSAPDRQLLGRSLRERRPMRHESHANRNQHNPRPALPGDRFLQPELRQQRHNHIPERGRRQHVRQIGPRQRSQIAGKESNQQRDPRANPRREDRRQQRQRDAPAKSAAGKSFPAKGTYRPAARTAPPVPGSCTASEWVEYAPSAFDQAPTRRIK